MGRNPHGEHVSRPMDSKGAQKALYMQVGDPLITTMDREIELIPLVLIVNGRSHEVLLQLDSHGWAVLRPRKSQGSVYLVMCNALPCCAWSGYHPSIV